MGRGAGRHGKDPRSTWASKYTVGIDEAAFYGPKLDIQYKNVFGKEDTLVTIQIDMLLAEQLRHGVCGCGRHEEAPLHHPPHVAGLL